MAFLAALTGLVALPGLFRGGYSPGLDHALLDLGTRHVTHGVVEVGTFSRFGWFHPGPAIYYLMAGPYLLTGGNSIGILFAALLINTVLLVLITLTFYRRAGLPAALLALLVLLVTLRALPSNVLADPWNPYLPILALVLLIVLSWHVVEGETRWLPALPVLASLCVQSHVGFLPPCLAALGAVAVVLAVRRVRPHLSWRRWACWGAALGLVWALPVFQQLTSKDGNLSALWRYFTTAHTPQPWSVVGRAVATELGRLPAYVLGVRSQPELLVPPRLPVWTAYVTVGCFTLAVLVAILRRYRMVTTFAALTVTTTVAALLAVRQVNGLLETYIVQWASVIGALAWITVVLTACLVVRETSPGLAGRLPARRAGYALLTVPVAAVIVVAVALGVSAGRSRPMNEPDAPSIATQLIRWLRTDQRDVGHPVVGLRYQTCTRPSLLCMLPPADAVIDQLVRRGVHVLPGDQVWAIRPLLPYRTRPAQLSLLLGYTHGDSPPPPPGWRRVAISGQLVVYAPPA